MQNVLKHAYFLKVIACYQFIFLTVCMLLVHGYLDPETLGIMQQKCLSSMV